MTDSPLANQIRIDDIEPEAVPNIPRTTGTITDVEVYEPNDFGDQYISIEIQYPVGSPSKETIRAGLYYNADTFGNPPDRDMDPKGFKKVNMNKAKIKALREAASRDGEDKILSFDDLVGRVVDFTAQPKWNDVTSYDFGKFMKPREQ